jgi:hypothetical protein
VDEARTVLLLVLGLIFSQIVGRLSLYHQHHPSGGSHLYVMVDIPGAAGYPFSLLKPGSTVSREQRPYAP